MLGAILGAMAGAMRKASEVTEDVGHRIGAPEWLVGGLSGTFSMAGDGLHAGKDLVPSFRESLAFVSSSVKTTFGGMTSEASLPEPTVKCGRNARQSEMSAVANNVPAKGYLEMSNGELFTLSAPQFGDQTNQIARSAGMNVG